MITSTDTVFEKFDSRTLRARIAEKIRSAILSGGLKEGQRLVERSLADQFGASLSAVREALIELETEGFVVKKPNSATFVTKLCVESADKIFAVRQVLEGYAVEEASRRATAEQSEGLQLRYLAVVDAARSGSPQRFIECDFALHEGIWQLTGNEYLQTALRRCVLPIFAFSAIRFSSGAAFDLLQDARSHLPVIEAIRVNDPAVARQAFTVALDDWRSKIFDFLFRKGPSPDGSV